MIGYPEKEVVKILSRFMERLAWPLQVRSLPLSPKNDRISQNKKQ
jgi:hypothetical protein